jgi:hypothetical protein
MKEQLSTIAKALSPGSWMFLEQISAAWMQQLSHHG